MRGMAWNSALGISMLLKAWYIVMDGLEWHGDTSKVWFLVKLHYARWGCSTAVQGWFKGPGEVS